MNLNQCFRVLCFLHVEAVLQVALVYFYCIVVLHNYLKSLHWVLCNMQNTTQNRKFPLVVVVCESSCILSGRQLYRHEIVEGITTQKLFYNVNGYQSVWKSYVFFVIYAKVFMTLSRFIVAYLRTLVSIFATYTAVRLHAWYRWAPGTLYNLTIPIVLFRDREKKIWFYFL